MKTLFIGPLSLSKESPFTAILGPCVIEDEEHTLQAARFLKRLADRLGIQLIFKASYDKANRSSKSSFRGVGLEEGLKILEKVKQELGVPVTSDIHLPQEAAMAAEVLDLLQIPAFLSRQTDLIVAAAKTGKPLNIKKGQFLAPWDMRQVVEKIVSEGNHQIMLTERGTTFGYNNLVADIRSIPLMQSLGFPVCFDASHSVQLPGGLGESSGGNREFIPHLAKAALAAGADLLFLETHNEPDLAKSDKATVFPFGQLEKLLNQLKRVHEIVRHDP